MPRKTVAATRTAITERAGSLIGDALAPLEDLRDELEAAYDGLPENFQNGEQGERLQEAKDKLSEIIDSIQENVDDLACIEF